MDDQPRSLSIDDQLLVDHPNAWTADSSSMDHHIASGYTGFENNDHFSQPRRSGKKQLFADSPMPAAGPSTQPFYNHSLKRKRDDSLEPIPPWLDDHTPMPIDDHPSPGSSYSKHRLSTTNHHQSFAVPRDRKGKGKEIDYKGKGKQREDNSPILISDSPVLNNVHPLPTTRVPTKSPSEPLSSYTCPICFSAPTNATLTPCGHICCGECLFIAVKTVMHRAQQAGAPDAQEARCPVCRALIPDWDGNGGGVIGLKARAIFSL